MYSSEQLLSAITTLIDEKKGEDVCTIDLRNKSSIADFLVIATATGARHASALADYLIEDIKARYDMRPLAVEGVNESEWVVVDYGDIIVHFFTPDTRRHYDIEQIWRVPGQPTSKESS